MTVDNTIQKIIRPSTNNAFDYNVITVKRMGSIDKVCYSASCRQAGIIVPCSKKGTAFDGKLSNNISRARSTIFEYSLCNKWTYFATLTIDKNKFNRYSLPEYKKALSQWLNNYNRNGVKVSYLLIPEFHKDGAVHMHGLLSDIPFKDLCINENGYLDWIPYHEKFGFISIGRIQNDFAVAIYITKYVTKELALSIKDCNAHLFYASKGLKKAERIYKAVNASLLAEPSYKTDYYSVLSLNNEEFDYHDYIQAGNCVYDAIFNI